MRRILFPLFGVLFNLCAWAEEPPRLGWSWGGGLGLTRNGYQYELDGASPAFLSLGLGGRSLSMAAALDAGFVHVVDARKDGSDLFRNTSAFETTLGIRLRHGAHDLIQRYLFAAGNFLLWDPAIARSDGSTTSFGMKLLVGLEFFLTPVRPEGGRRDAAFIEIGWRMFHARANTLPNTPDLFNGGLVRLGWRVHY